MADTSRSLKMEEMINYSNNLIDILKDEKDFAGLKNFVHQSNALQSQCDKDLTQVKKSVEDYNNKIEACKQKADAAQSESAADAELELLEKELEEVKQLEQRLNLEFRGIINEIDGLESGRAFLEEQNRNMKKSEQDELRAQMKLSMYASVTNVIPYLDYESKISGHIVDRDKKVVEKFEFDQSEATAFDTCNTIWKMINSR